MITLGVVADTHVPDKVRRLNPEVLSVFRAAKVGAILHAGDVSIPRVLTQLEEVAPVHAVRGNRDWVRMRHLPAAISLTFEGVTVGLTHGHGRLGDYLVEKFRFLTQGYRFERYYRVVKRIFPDAGIIVFGHSHIPANVWVEGVLYFNPGTASLWENDLPPSVGIVHIHDGGKVEAEIVVL
jgi:putative phosphoesterase